MMGITCTFGQGGREEKPWEPPVLWLHIPNIIMIAHTSKCDQEIEFCKQFDLEAYFEANGACNPTYGLPSRPYAGNPNPK